MHKCILIIQIESSSITSGPSTEGEQTSTAVAETNVDLAGQAASLSSLEEITSGLAKRSRRRPTLDRQHSESSSWTVCEEDGGSERVRFDHHVSFIEADQEANGMSSVPRGLGRRKRNKEPEQDADSQKTSRLNT